MCLTLANAADVAAHSTSEIGRGYSLTSHHSGYLAPGDLWRPDPAGHPHTVTEVNRKNDEVLLTDQTGETYAYPTGSILPTAVMDPLLPVHRELLHS